MEENMNSITQFMDSLSVGETQSKFNLSMTPILAKNPAEADYLLLDQALEKDVIEISEVSDSGSVPNLQVLNKGTAKVLLLDGEELLGAKQNRIINVSIMVPPHESITIPVSCVESGRWRHESAKFRSAGRAHYAEGRARKVRSVNRTLRESGSRHGDQGEVWNNISMKMSRMDASSDTEASDAMYRTHRRSLDDYRDAFSPSPNQVGAVFSINGNTSGADLFDSSTTLSSTLGKLVESYSLDAIDQQIAKDLNTPKVSAKDFLKRIGNSKPDIHPAVGMGHDFRIDDEGLAGGALVLDDRAIHLCAFNLAEEELIPVRRTRLVRRSVRDRRS